MESKEEELAVLLRARYPFIYIDSYEENRIVKFIDNININYRWNNYKSLNRTIYTWSLTSGMRILNGDNKNLIDKKNGVQNEALKALDFIANDNHDAIYILKDFHVFLNDKRYSNEIIRKLRDLLQILRSCDNNKNVIFISPVLIIPDEMQKEITIFDFPLPNEDEILKIFSDIIKNNQLITVKATLSETRELARSALGMTSLEAENAFSRAIVQYNGVVSMSMQSIIYEEKKQCIRKNTLLEYVDSDLKAYDVGGLDVLKKWLAKHRNSWTENAKNYGLPVPKGILITGIPGCGKSLIAKTMSSMWGLPLIQLDMGRIYNGLVGSSEENMRKAISTAESMSPCVLWVDEIEKGLAGSESQNDSGTSARVFGTLLTWMQEKKKCVFILATANDISALKPEFLRKGRFDEIFYVDLPTKMERKEIFRIHINKRRNPAFTELPCDDDRLYEYLSLQTDGFVGSELEAVVISAMYIAYAENRKVRKEDLDIAIRNTIPLSKTQREQIQKIREWAQNNAVSATSSAYREINESNKNIGRILNI